MYLCLRQGLLYKLHIYLYLPLHMNIHLLLFLSTTQQLKRIEMKTDLLITVNVVGLGVAAMCLLVLFFGLGVLIGQNLRD